MNNSKTDSSVSQMIEEFNLKSLKDNNSFTRIGSGSIGGKASGLAFIKDKLKLKYDEKTFKPFLIDIPWLTVITTKYFDSFMKNNNLYEVAFSGVNDERITYHFLKGTLPVELVGNLRILATNFTFPLAVRSSSLLEDQLDAPLAGIYETKMIPNNQPDVDTRFTKLSEAIKFVYASTFFKKALTYLKSVSQDIKNEKMAIIIQKVAGQKYNNHFYPNISGVAKSYNFYSSGNAKPEDGVVSLALGLGKTVVEGGNVWNYSPKYPKSDPPYNSINQLMKHTQLDFWSINLSKPTCYNPLIETEFLIKLPLKDAEYEDTIRTITSTFDIDNNRITIGMSINGPRIINFGPLLKTNILPFSKMLQSIIGFCEEIYNSDLEIEFAVSLSTKYGRPHQFSLLQIRPMKSIDKQIKINTDNLNRENVLALSKNTTGNGEDSSIKNIVYINPDSFDFKHSKEVVSEIEEINQYLVEQDKKYLLVGFGRWGSSEPWLGIPIDWGQISGAKAIIESSLKNTAIDFSQGSHFFHNLLNLEVFYFSIDSSEKFPIDWDWLSDQSIEYCGKFVRHIKLKSPLFLQVDGRKKQGVIFK